MGIRRVLGAIAPSLALLLSLPGGADGEVVLTLLVKEAPTDAPTTARVSVTGSDGSPCCPAPDSTCLFHTALGGFFYVDSAATLTAPEGTTRLRAAKGPEYEFVDRTFVLSGDTTVVVDLERWIEPRDAGWVGGDTHAHLTHPPLDYHVTDAEAKRAADAEGLRVATFLENGYLFTGSVGARSDSASVVYFSEEYRSPFYGHLGLLGLEELVEPNWAWPGWPLNAEITDEVRGQGHALAVYAHPHTTDDFGDLDDWPGTGLARGLWIDAPLGKIDAYDLLSYSNVADYGGAALEYWYDLWNAGFCLPVSAGTDQCLGQRGCKPLGGFRVYARVPDPRAPPEDLYDEWVEALRRGETFVTSGPLLTVFDVGGAGPGETLLVSGGMPADVGVTARFESARNLKRIEIVVNGEVVQVVTVPHAREYEIETTVPVRETSWIAVRHDGVDTGDFLCTDRPLAHPTPVLVVVAGDALTSPAASARALGYLDLVESLLAEVADYPSAAESIAVADGIAAARTSWNARSNGAPDPFDLVSPCRGCETETARPTLAWNGAIDPDSGTGAGILYRVVLAADAGYETIVADSSGVAETWWTPAEDLVPGARYWWRVSASDAGGDVRWSTSIGWWFRPGVSTTVAGAPPPPLRLLAVPNPFNPHTTIRYELTEAGPASLRVYGVDGRLVRTLFDGARPSGRHAAAWDGRDDAGRDAPPAVYLLLLRSGVRAESRKIVRLD